jgi:hypothetical protein
MGDTQGHTQKIMTKTSRAFIVTIVLFTLVESGLGDHSVAVAAHHEAFDGLASGFAVTTARADELAASSNREKGNDQAQTSGTWSSLTTPPVSITNCLLLTDGRVMCQRNGTNQWYALTPNSSGSYVNGSWSALASMQSGYDPIYFASAVLADGRVIVEGGEYNCNSSGASCMSVWQTVGAIYDPATNGWASVSPPSGWTTIGDASGIVLADGTFFLSDCCSKKTAKFNSASLTWTAFGTGYQATNNDEAGWTMLPDNSLLTVDASPANTKLSERFNPVTGVWSGAGNTPVSLCDNDSARGSDASFEIGSGILRPNGTVFYVGANPNIGTACCSGAAHTAVFTVASSTWSAGPNVPGSDAANDAPSAVLPNGNVFFQAAPPASTTNVFGSPSHFYEYDGTTITLVNSPPNTSYPSYEGAMLVLPTGQILFTRQSTDVQVYTPAGAANPAWAPTITSVTSSMQPGGTYTISGTQFNGLTQGAAYGDDLQAATNYPIVRITNNATGHIFYARTRNHSSMAVATGAATVSTSLTVPAGIELGASTLVVIANGIPSSAVSVTISTLTPTATATSTPTSTFTPTLTPTHTATSTPTNTATNTATPTNSATKTATSTPTNTATNTATNTPRPTPVSVALPAMTAPPGSEVTIPITVGDTTGLQITSYDLQVTFDPVVVQPAATPYDATGTLSNSMSITPNSANSGQFIISAFQETNLAGSGTLINLKFTIVGASGQSTALTFEDYTDPSNIFHPGFAFNEGTPGSAVTNGSITVFAPTISGAVTYGNAAGAPTPRFVSNVTVTGSGSANVMATTGPPGATAGQYSLTGFGAGSYTVTPTKIGGQNGAINSFDAAKIAQHVTGISPLTGNQLLVADVSNNGSINSFDAAQIANYAVSGSSAGIAGSWKFIPVNRMYTSVTANVAGEDYSALLMGEISGNWTNTGARPASDNNGPERITSVSLPQLRGKQDGELIIPVNVQDAADKGIISCEFALRYDPSVIMPATEPVELAGTLTRGLSVVVNAKEPGLLRVVIYGAFPIDGDGLLVNLRFLAVGPQGSVSPLTWEKFVFNDGEPTSAAADGRIELSDLVP